MLKLYIIVVDRTRIPFIRDGESFYLKRLRRYARVEWIEVKGARINKNSPPDLVRAEEGANIIKKIPPRSYSVSLDRSGSQTDSPGLAGHLEAISREQSSIAFIIGGPLGLSKEVLDHSNRVLSLSSMTLTHEMCRIFLLEQIYRAFTIIRGEKYHK
jgi:23S rRNA (pseudouridine1915-N3)-methyltransferase